jgi:ParB/RepB/Spo0J family partition protein
VSTPTTTARRAQEITLDRIEAGGNIRELDAEHVTALAGSMAVRGLIVPVAVRPLDGERYALVAGEHRLAAARELGWTSIAAVITDHTQGVSGDQGAENVLRKTLTPLEEARAVEKMLADGYTVDGAATVLGWHKRRVTARQRILELPETAQTLVGSGEIPVAGIDALLEIQAISPELAALVAEAIAEAAAEGSQLGAQLARDPGWLVRQALSHRPGVLFAALAGDTLYEDQIAELKLGKKTTALYAEAKTLHGQLDRYAYGPPPVRIGEAELDQARAAGVLLELDRTQVILDRGVYRELVKAAVARTVEDLRARATERASEQRERKTASRRERTPREETDAEHRAQQREFTRRAHNVNLDLGAALLDGLATVDPDNMDVARFYCLCRRPHRANYADASAMPRRVLRSRGRLPSAGF